MRLSWVPLASAALFVLRSAFANVAPEALTHADPAALYKGAPAAEVTLSEYFRDPDVSAAVRINFRIGAAVKPMDIALYEQQTPITTANFLRYIQEGLAANNFIHRSVPGFIIQGGGFRWTDTGTQAVPTFDKIHNEPGISNVRGTLAMAKLGGDPDSATSQWFVNLADNSANLDAQNGGFTVFARVLGDGMAVADEVAAVPRYNLQGAFDTIPLKDVTNNQATRYNTIETNAEVVPVLSFQAVSSDEGLVSVAVTGSTLSLTPSATHVGTCKITVTATDLEGASTTRELTVVVQSPDVTMDPPVVTQPSPLVLTADAAGSATVPDWRGTTVTATDENGIAQFVQTPAPGTRLSVGTYAVTFAASNSGGQTTTVSTTLTVSFSSVNSPTVTVADAHSNGAAPSLDGSISPYSFSSFGVPAISDLRQIVGRALVKSGSARLLAIYREDAAHNSSLVALQGKDSGIPNAKFKWFRDPVVAPGGAIAFQGTVSGVPAGTDTAIWTDLFGDLAPVLREGAFLPGQPGIPVKSFTNLSIDDGVLYAMVKLAPTASAIPGKSDIALLQVTGATASKIVAQTGKSFDGSTIKSIAFLQPAATSPGQGRWNSGKLGVVKLTLADKRVVIAKIDADGFLTKVVQAGVQDPKLQTTLTKLGLPAIGGTGIAFTASEALGADVTGANDTALLYAADGLNPAELLREGESAGVVDGATFASFADPVVNDRGTLLFAATLRATATVKKNLAGLWTIAAEGTPKLVARVGDPAVDRDGNVIPGATFASFNLYALPDGTDAGAEFVAKVKGTGVKANNATGLWAQDSAGKLRLLLRTGDTLSVAGATKKIGRILVLNSTPGAFGARRSYNGTRSLAVLVTLTDLSQTVVRVDVP